MLKIVVFDGGWGGQVVANYLANELQVMEVIPVIDWTNAPYDNKTPSEICNLAEQCLAEYFDKVDLIVLAGYVVSLALDSLRLLHQEQKIISVGVNFYRILHGAFYPERITLLMANSLLQTEIYDELQEKLPYSTLSTPDCSGWEERANLGELSREMVYAELCGYFHVRKPLQIKFRANKPTKTLLEQIREEKQKTAHAASAIPIKASAVNPPEIWPEEKLIHSDVVLLLNTHLWDMKDVFEDVFGYKVRVLDFREKLLHDICTTLGLLGLDGKRSK